jgi:hypothetical protein
MADISSLPADDIRNYYHEGDIIPARHVNAKVIGYNDFTHPYLRTADFLKNADITVTNLEHPLFSGVPQCQLRYDFLLVTDGI